MRKSDLRIIIESIIGIILIVFAIKFFLYLLPVILILIGVYVVYKSFYKSKKVNVKDNINTQRTRKNKKDSIQEAVVVKETEEK